MHVSAEVKKMQELNMSKRPQCIFSVAKKGMSYGGSNGGVTYIVLIVPIR